MLNHDTMLRSIFTIYILLHCGFCSDEPKCSPFHYQEQLLEKMIRMEVKVEKMEQEILNTNKQVLESLNDLKQEKDSVIEAKAAFEKELAELKQNINMEAATVRDTLLTPTVAFKARGPADISLKTGQTVIYNTVMMNYGNGYDNITGIFTAPVDGTYLFTMHACLQTGAYFFYGIVCDDDIQTSGDFFESGYSICSTADAVMVLNVGQKVWIKCLLSTQSGNILFEYDTATNNRWNTFSGVLIHM